MCGRVNNHLSRLHAWSKMLGKWPSVVDGFNVAPSAQLAVFLEDESKKLHGEAMRWGLVPKWSKSFETKYNTHNARLETINEKPTFRPAWKKQQKCLIPIAGYYEWQATNNGGQKQPFYVTDKNEGGLVLAGLYECWGEDVSETNSFTIITKPASVELNVIHSRMPVMLSPDSAATWLRSDLVDDQNSLNEIDPPNVVYWPVSRSVGNIANQNSRLCDAIDLV